MTAKVVKTIVREVQIGNDAFTVTISPDGVRLARKRMRSGAFYSWRQLWQGVVREHATEHRPGRRQEDAK